MLNGDLIAHKVAQDVDYYDPELYNLLLDTHVTVQQMFSKYLPDTPVFLTLGNNDCKFHDSAPFQADKEGYYSFMFDLWFQQHPGNWAYRK